MSPSEVHAAANLPIKTIVAGRKFNRERSALVAKVCRQMRGEQDNEDMEAFDPSI